MNTKDREWFALSSSDKLWRLGDCGNFDAAKETANDWGLEVIWVAKAATVNKWADTINKYPVGV